MKLSDKARQAAVDTADDIVAVVKMHTRMRGTEIAEEEGGIEGFEEAKMEINAAILRLLAERGIKV
jgi:hypothetical protein